MYGRWWLLRHLFRASPKLEELCLGAYQHHSKGFYNFSVRSLKRLRMKDLSSRSGGKFLAEVPMLEELVIADKSFQEYIIRGKPSLASAKIDIGRPIIKEDQRSHVYHNRVCKLLCTISNVKVLYLKAYTINALSINCKYEHNLPHFPALSSLQLCFINYSSWNVITKFLETAPKLEVLILRKDFKRTGDHDFPEYSTWTEPCGVPYCLSSCLRQVEIWDCQSHQMEFDLISYLLKHGNVLTTFLVDLLPGKSRKDLKFRDTLMSCPKGLDTCQLKISVRPQCPGNSSVSAELYGRLCPQQLSYEDLRICTGYFSDSNLIARTKHFELYRGKFYQGNSQLKDVTVKIWVMPANPDEVHKRDSMRSFCGEQKLLKDPYFSSHPYFLRLFGHCAEDNGERLGVVYDFNPLETLENLIPEDSFNWLQRIQVALALACNLAYLHEKPGDFPPKDYMPLLYNPVRGKEYNNHKCQHLEFNSKNEVFRFAIVLFGLISKTVLQRPQNLSDKQESVQSYLLPTYIYREKNFTDNFYKSKELLVHKNFNADPTYDAIDGLKLTRLVMCCIDGAPEGLVDQPSINGIVKYLCKLRVVKENWNVIDRDNRLSNYFNAGLS